MRNFLLILLLLTTICPLCGQDNYWNTNVSQYNNSMNVVAAIRYNGIVQNSTDLELAAFCGDELRGNMRIQYNANVYIAFITIYGDKSVQITFKVYDHSILEFSQFCFKLHSPSPLNVITSKSTKTGLEGVPIISLDLNVTVVEEA